jgi:hypothetical protein
MNMRQEFAIHKEKLRPFIIKKYDIKDPGSYPTKVHASATAASMTKPDDTAI